MVEEAHRNGPILDFQRMYCTVCMFLQSKLSGIRNEKQSKATHFHLLQKPTNEDCKKGPKTPPKGPQNSPLGTLKTHRGGLRIRTPLKIAFAAAHPPVDLLVSGSGTWTGDHGYI